MGFVSVRRLFALSAVLALVAPAGASAATLYDQLDHAASGSGDTTDSYFYPMGENVQAADDFTVPSGQAWQLTGAHEPNPHGYNAYEFSVTIFPDAGGRPGSPLFQATAPGTGGSIFTFPISGAPSLQPGHYWISIQLMNLVAWAWQNRTVQSGSPAMLQNPDGMEFTSCTTWSPRAQCDPSTSSSPDQAFSLDGNATSTSPPKKKCKRKKHKRSAEVAKKKCKKKKKGVSSAKKKKCKKVKNVVLPAPAPLVRATVSWTADDEVDLHAFDSSGNHAGWDTNTSGVVNQIPSAHHNGDAGPGGPSESFTDDIFVLGGPSNRQFVYVICLFDGPAHGAYTGTFTGVTAGGSTTTLPLNGPAVYRVTEPGGPTLSDSQVAAVCGL